MNETISVESIRTVLDRMVLFYLVCAARDYDNPEYISKDDGTQVDAEMAYKSSLLASNTVVIASRLGIISSEDERTINGIIENMFDKDLSMQDRISGKYGHNDAR
jgi:hypothetical protein